MGFNFRGSMKNPRILDPTKISCHTVANEDKSILRFSLISRLK